MWKQAVVTNSDAKQDQRRRLSTARPTPIDEMKGIALMNAPLVVVVVFEELPDWVSTVPSPETSTDVLLL